MDLDPLENMDVLALSLESFHNISCLMMTASLRKVFRVIDLLPCYNPSMLRCCACSSKLYSSFKQHIKGWNQKVTEACH